MTNSQKEESMTTYEKPKVTRFGTLRELTHQGRFGPVDGATVHGDGCRYDGERCS
jgi:hypothetical protein